MPQAVVRGAHINYAVVGEAGPWIALSPGGRRGYVEVEGLARRLAEAGYRVLLHDRRNCGASDVGFDGTVAETDMWADDLHALAGQIGALPLYIGGASSGARMALAFALRHATDVLGVLLWRVTGGAKSAADLAQSYYGQYVALAERGGMAAVCASEHFAACIAARPQNRDALMGMAPAAFIAVMTRWRDGMLAGADLPILGASEAQLRGLAAPVCLTPGNDGMHTYETAARVAALLPDCELHEVVERRPPGDPQPDWMAEWVAEEPRLAEVLTEWLGRRGSA